MMTKPVRIAPSAALALAMMSVLGTADAQDAEAAAQAPQEAVDEIVVRGVFVPDEKRATSEISSVLDAEDFLRGGDSGVADALLRVTGVTIQDGRFPVVRGLNERYSSATLNGVPLPSPEPLRRAAPLDIFPTSILEGTLVQKTFSPQYSGEFGGGLIELRARTVPDEDFLSVGIGASIDTETTMREGLFYEGSDTDRFGFDDGLRDLPEGVDAAVRSGQAVPLAPELAAGFDGQATLLQSRGDTPASGGGSISAGKVFVDDGDVRFGTLIYASYDESWQNRDGFRERDPLLDNQLFVRSATGLGEEVSNFFETRQTIQLNALNTTGVEFGGGDHEIALTSFILRDTLKRAQSATTFVNDRFGADTPFLNERNEFIERQVWQTQLSGEHLFADLGDLEVAWRAAYGEAERNSPYDRTTSYLDFGAGPIFNTDRPEDTTVNFSFLEDQNVYAGLDVQYPLTFGEIGVDLSAGASYSDKSRDNLRRDFTVRTRPGIDPVLRRSRADLVFSDPSVLSRQITINSVASGIFPDQSSASLEVLGVYGAADVELNEFLRASVGVRFEDSEQDSSVGLTFNEAAGLDTTLEDDFFLPAATITWNPAGNLQVRGGYSRTITRPQFRELAPTIFTDPDLDSEFFGNPFLVNTEIDNFDVRAEYYFGREQFFTLGAFYKDLSRPIEQVLSPVGDGSQFTFINAPSAEVYGGEFEFEKRFSLDGLGREAFAGKDLFFSTNYTYSDSSVSADGDVVTSQSNANPRPSVLPAAGQFEDGRRLQGQSKHLFNVSLGVEDPDSGSRATVLVNYQSDRILFVSAPISGGGLIPSVIEEPPTSVDLVIAQDVELGGGVYNLGVKLENLLADDYSAYQEDAGGQRIDYQTYDRGRVLSVSIGRTF